MKLPIYMDYHATTPVDPRVLNVMVPYFGEMFGNASSRQHSFGRTALEAVEKARHQVAQLIHGRDKEIVFTSGATESNNMAILGVAEACRQRGNHIVTCQTEHRSVLDPCLVLEKSGFRTTRLGVGRDGLLDVDELASAICSDTILVSIMVANNEIGVLQPVEDICAVARERGVLVHADAAQACGKIAVDVERLGVHLLSLSAHKMYGPKGIGALFVRQHCPGLRVAPRIHGGGHERGLRSGTLNVPGIVGFGAACAIAQDEMPAESAILRALRDLLGRLLHEQVPQIAVNGSMVHRLPGNLNVSFHGLEGESPLVGLSDIAVSSASACTSAATEPSHVLKALGLTPQLAHASLRFGLGRWTTEEEIVYVARRVAEEARVEAFLVKPVHARGLLDTVHEAAARGRGAVAPEEAPPAVPRAPEPAGTHVLDAHTLTELELLGTGPKFVRDVTQGFLRDGEALLVEMRQALDAGQPNRYRDAAHALKGSAGSVGAMVVYKITSKACRLPDHQVPLQGTRLLREMRTAFDAARRALLEYLDRRDQQEPASR